MNGVACRLCSSPLDRVFIDLGMSPLSNANLRAEQLHTTEPFYPLRVFVCDACMLVQLPEVSRAENIFADDYAYFSSFSTTWLEHCERYAREIIAERSLGSDDLVLEIASNDGYLLQYFVRAGVPALGVEPAANVARVARDRGIRTIQKFFSVSTAREIVAEHGRANLIVGNNVLAHVPDLHGTIEGVRIALAEGGVCTFEFPHVLRMMQGNQFDTIYHEHFSYFSLHTARRAFAEHALHVYDVAELPTHGGSLRLFVRHARGSDDTVSERLLAVERLEEAAGMRSLEGYVGFPARVHAVKRDLVELLIQARRRGEHIVAYGAAAKGNTLLNYCGIREDLVDYIVDRSPHKQGRFTPGTHIPIRSPEEMERTKPSLIVLLPWNLRAELLEQLDYTRRWAARFVVAIPALEVIA